MSNKNWRDFIPTYLRDYCSQFNTYFGDIVHLLIVEGPSDESFYWHLFDKAYFSYNNRKIVFNTPKKRIISNFSNYLDNELFLKSEPYKYQQRKKEFDSLDTDNYRAYLFVTECISYYETNKEFFKSIDCYGIIDNDFGHSDLIKGLTNISTTKFHDRETCILRCYLPELIDQYSNTEKFIVLLSNIIDTTFKQGIIEELSHKYESTYGKDDFLRQLTNYFFKDGCSKIDLRKSSFDFIDYLMNYENYLSVQVSSNHETIYQNFVIDAINKIHTIYTFEDELTSILHRWLIDKNASDIDNKRIDRVFKYCNGHILLNQIIMHSGDSSSNSEEEFINQIIEKIMYGKKKYPLIFELPPLKSYKEHREEKELFTYVS